MPALLKSLIASLLCTLCTLSAAQDVGVVQIGNANTVNSDVALEIRIQSLIDELGISGEQELNFRVAMQQVSVLEAAYLEKHREKTAAPSNDSEVLSITEKLLAPVLYPTQVSAFRELEQIHLWQMRGQH